MDEPNAVTNAAPRSEPPRDAEPATREPVPGGRAEARRATSAGLADLTQRQVDAVAALDRALEARLGEFDRAFASRRAHLEGRLSEAEGNMAEAVDTGITAFKRAASDERRMLHEAAAAQLAALERAAQDHVRELEEVVSSQLASLQGLLDRVQQLEQAVAARAPDGGGGIPGSIGGGSTRGDRLPPSGH